MKETSLVHLACLEQNYAHELSASSIVNLGSSSKRLHLEPIRASLCLDKAKSSNTNTLISPRKETISNKIPQSRDVSAQSKQSSLAKNATFNSSVLETSIASVKFTDKTSVLFKQTAKNNTSLEKFASFNDCNYFEYASPCALKSNNNERILTKFAPNLALLSYFRLLTIDPNKFNFIEQFKDYPQDKIDQAVVDLTFVSLFQHSFKQNNLDLGTLDSSKNVSPVATIASGSSSIETKIEDNKLSLQASNLFSSFASLGLYDCMSFALRASAIFSLLLAGAIYQEAQSSVNDNAIAATNCNLITGCNLNPKGFKQMPSNLKQNNSRYRFKKNSTNNGGYRFSIAGSDSKTIIGEFSDGFAKSNGSIILYGRQNKNESFLFGASNDGIAKYYGKNAFYDLNQVVIYESALYQSALANNQGATIKINDLWINEDSGIVSYYDKNTATTNNPNPSTKLLGAKLSVDQIYVPHNATFQLTFIEKDIKLDKNSPKDNDFDVKLNKVTSRDNTKINFMGTHATESRKGLPFIPHTSFYRGQPYYHVLAPMEIDAINSTYLFGADIGIDHQSRNWEYYPDYEAWGITGEKIHKAYVLERLTFDQGFNWLNKSIDNSSTIKFFATDFVENNMSTKSAPDSIEMIFPRFYGNNTFNGIYYDLYEAEFYRNAKTDRNLALVEKQHYQQFKNLRNAEVNLHRSLTLKDNNPKNFQALHFGHAKVLLKGDPSNKNIFDLIVDDMEFSHASPDYGKDIEDVLTDTADHDLLGSKKTAILTADSISIAVDTDLHINQRHISDSSNTVRQYTTANSHNVEYTISDAFEISKTTSDNITNPSLSQGGEQTLYYVDKALLFTMYDESVLNLDPKGQSKFLAVPIFTRGEGEKTINFLNSEEQRGIVNVAVKVPNEITIGIGTNTTAQLGLNNALGDGLFTINMADAQSKETGAIIDINNHHFALEKSLINLGHNSQIINSKTAKTLNDLPKPVVLFGHGYDDTVMRLGHAKDAFIETDLSILHGTLDVAYTYGHGLDNSFADKNLATLHIGSVDGKNPSRFTISGNFEHSPDLDAQSHLMLGGGQLHVHSGSSLVLGQNIGIHIDRQNFDTFQYDLENKENQHLSGGHIVVDQGGTIEINLEEDSGSHLSVDHIINVNDHHFLISGNEEALDEQNPVINRVKIKIGDDLYEQLGQMSDQEIQDLEDRLDAILQKANHLDNHIHFQDFSIEIRKDGIFLTAHNIVDKVEDILPDLEADEVLEDFIDISSGEKDDEALPEEIEISKELPIYNYLEDILHELMPPSNIDKYGHDNVVQAVTESIDHSMQLASTSKLQAMALQGLDLSFNSIDQHLNLATLWPLEHEQNKNLWVDAFYSHTESDAGKFNHGLQSSIDLKGIVLGYDHYLNPELLVGAAIGYNQGTSINKKHSDTLLNVDLNGDLDSILFMLYTAYQPYEHLLLKGDVILAKGRGHFDYKDAFDHKMADDVNLFSYRFDIKALMPFNLSEHISIAPYVAFSSNHIMTDKYQVKFHDGQYSQNKTQDINLMELPLGIKLDGKFKLTEESNFLISTDLSYISYFGDTSFNNSSHFGGLFRDAKSKSFLSDDQAFKARVDLGIKVGDFIGNIFGSMLQSDSIKNHSIGLKLNYTF